MHTGSVFGRVGQKSLAIASFSLVLACGCGSGIGIPGSGSSNVASPVASTIGPQLGYFWNAADQTLRPVLGIPGASQIGSSVVPAGEYVSAAASSASEIGILQAPDGSLDIMALPTGQPQHLSASTTPDAKIRFSPDGKSALIFSSGKTSVTVITGLGNSPLAAAVSSSGEVLDAAVSDAGRVVIATSSATGTLIQIAGANGAMTALGTAGSLGGLSFTAGDDLLYADASANTLTVVHNASTAPSPAQVATASLLKAPAALGVSPNGRFVLVANGGESSVVRLDLTTQNAPLRIGCACTPVLVAPLSGDGAFRITAPGSGPIWAIDAQVQSPRAFFIPAVPAAAKTAGQQ